MTVIYDAIIVGGGISGLIAARKLLKNGRRVLVLEARDRLGGRIHTFRKEKDGHFVDLGANFVHGLNGNPLTKIAKDLKLPLDATGMTELKGVDHTGQQLDEELLQIIGRNVFTTLFHNTRQTSQNGPDIPSLNTSLAEPVFHPGSSLYADLTEPRDKLYVESLARNFDGWTGASLEKVSYKWWGWEREFEGVDGFMSGGYDKIIDWLHEDIKKAKGIVKLEEEVTAVEVAGEDEGAHVQITVKSTAKSPVTISSPYRAQVALITLPLGVLKSRPPKFTPPLPPRRLQVIENLGMGVLNKIALFYPEAWWPDDGGFMLVPDPEHPANLTGPNGTSRGPQLPARAAFVINLWTRSKVPALLWFIGGDTGDRLEDFTDEEIAEWAQSTINQYLGPGHGSTPPAPTKVMVTRWRGDPYSQGSYAYFPVKGLPKDALSSFHPAAGFSAEGGGPVDCAELSHPLWDRFFFAGEHTDQDHFASVHGAYLSGVREAVKIENALVAFEEEAA